MCFIYITKRVCKLPVDNNWVLMSGLQILTCLPCDKHQYNTGKKNDSKVNIICMVRKLNILYLALNICEG